MNPLIITKVVDVTKHAILRTVSVICVLGVIIGLGWAIYAGIIRPVTKPNPSTTQNAEKIDNIYYYPIKKVFGFGFNLWGCDIGIVKYDYPKEPIVKMEIKK